MVYMRCLAYLCGGRRMNWLTHLYVCVSYFQFVREWRSGTNPKLSSNPQLTRYNPHPFFPLSQSSFPPFSSLHLSFPHSDKVILKQSEIRRVSSSSDRQRWGQAQISRRQEHSCRVDGYLSAFWRIWEFMQPYRCIFCVCERVAHLWQMCAPYYESPPLSLSKLRRLYWVRLFLHFKDKESSCISPDRVTYVYSWYV